MLIREVKMFRNKLFFCGLAAILLIALYGHSQVYKNPYANIELRVNDLLSKMTLEEKIDQLSGTGDTDFDTRENTRVGNSGFY